MVNRVDDMRAHNVDPVVDCDELVTGRGHLGLDAAEYVVDHRVEVLQRVEKLHERLILPEVRRHHCERPGGGG